MSQELIERLRDEANRLQADGGEELAALLDDAIEEIERMRASERSAWNAAVTRDEQIERLKVDAERYRWLRTADSVPISPQAARDPVAYDAAIDAAMAKQKEGLV